MGRRLAAPSLLLLGVLAVPGAHASPGAPGSPAEATPPRSELIRQTIEAGRLQGRIRLSPDLVYAAAALPRFYEERAFEPAWTGADAPLAAARTLFAILSDAERHGLRATDYHVGRIGALLAALDSQDAAAPPPDETVERDRSLRLTTLDLLLTDGALLFASHLASGKTDPTSVHPQWRADRPELDSAAFLAGALETGALRRAYAELEPPAPEYRRMIAALERLRRVADTGGWETFPPGPALHPGEIDPRVPALHARLAASGDLPAVVRGTPSAEADPLLYDETLAAGVRSFQSRHGLSADGVIGDRTAAALAVPVERRIDQVLVNLERWRWLPRDLGERHLRVNIAGFELQLVDRGSVVLSMRVIVGKQYTKTPVFSGRMTYLVLNPAWWVPGSIARGEILPKVQADPGYLEKNGYEILDGTGPSARVLDPASIDWAALSPGAFPYVVRQRPGPGSSLGRIKLMLPNPYNVYLHDTPEKRLFERDVRAFSHGCIRLERAFDLAAYLLRDDPEWSAERLEEEIASGEQKTVLLPRPLPVHIQYWTAWVDPAGALQLRDDVYRRDAAVLAALRSVPPTD